MNKNTDTMAENTQEKLVSRAQQYGQSLFDHYGKSVDLAAERLHKYMPLHADGNIDKDEIDAVCRSTELGAQLVALLRETTDPVGEELLTSYAADLMFYEYLQLADTSEN